MLQSRKTYVNTLNRHVDEVQQLVMITNRCARGEEDHNFLPSILLQEGEQQQETFIGFTNNITLLKTSNCSFFASNFNLDGIGMESSLNKFIDFGRRGCREEHRLAFLRQNLQDFLDFQFETNIQNTIGLIDDQAGKILEHEALCILKMIQKTTRSSNEDTNARNKLLCFCVTVRTSHYQSVSELREEFHYLVQYSVGLHSQLTSRSNNHTSSSTIGLPFQL